MGFCQLVPVKGVSCISSSLLPLSSDVVGGGFLVVFPWVLALAVWLPLSSSVLLSGEVSAFCLFALVFV